MQKNCHDLKALVIGATGGGKSSLINLFYCWSKGWNVYDILSLRKVLIKTKYLDGDAIAEANVNDQGQSQTTFAKLYQFYIKVPHQDTSYLLHFLDTPGLGDTRGNARDEKNIELISETVAKTEELNAIILVMNGAEARLNARVQYVLKKLHSIIPASLVQNVMVLLTNVGLEPNLNVREALDFEIDDSRLYWYDNQVFNLHPKYFDNKNMLARCQQTYSEAIGTVTDMLQKIASLPVVTTQDFSQIQEMRDKFKRDIVILGEIIYQGLVKQVELKNLYKDVSKDNLEISDLEKRLIQCSEESLWKTVQTQHPNTICCTCKKTCHESCTFEQETKGSQRIKACLAFDYGSSDDCLKCNHSYTSHMRLNEYYVKRKGTVNGTQNNIKASIENTGQRRDAKVAVMKAITNEIEKINQEQHNAKSKIISLLKNIRSVCSRFNYIKQIDECIYIFQEQLRDLQKEDPKAMTEENNLKIQGLSVVQKTLENLKDEIVRGLQTEPESKCNVQETLENKADIFAQKPTVSPANASTRVGTQRAASHDNRRNIDNTSMPQRNFKKESFNPMSSREGFSAPKLPNYQTSKSNSHFPKIGNQEHRSRKEEPKINSTMKMNQDYSRGRQAQDVSPQALNKFEKLRVIEKNLETLIYDISLLESDCAEELQNYLHNFNNQINVMFQSRNMSLRSEKQARDDGLSLNFGRYNAISRSQEVERKNDGIWNKALGLFRFT